MVVKSNPINAWSFNLCLFPPSHPTYTLADWPFDFPCVPQRWESHIEPRQAEIKEPWEERKIANLNATDLLKIMRNTKEKSYSVPFVKKAADKAGRKRGKWNGVTPSSNMQMNCGREISTRTRPTQSGKVWLQLFFSFLSLSPSPEEWEETQA